MNKVKQNKIFGFILRTLVFHHNHKELYVTAWPCVDFLPISAKSRFKMVDATQTEPEVWTESSNCMVVQVFKLTF